ncbi:MAG TPA: DUF4190 domain-containing protein [Micromonosporaceae bacterium]|nr:DUF4190 domain-containing protein [Micromonosporaceae bacterium]
MASPNDPYATGGPRDDAGRRQDRDADDDARREAARGGEDSGLRDGTEPTSPLYPPQPPQSYPPQSGPPYSYPQQDHPAQSYPPPGYQSTGYPAPGFPPGAYPQPHLAPGQQPARGTNVMAILSLVLAFVFAPAGIVLGHIAKRQIRQTGEEGATLANVGLVLSYVFTGLAVVGCCIGIIALASGANTNAGY